MRTICTIGFAGKTAEDFFRLLREAGVKRVMDVRENRLGQLSGFAKFPDIAFLLKEIAGIEYVYEPLFAPSAEIREAYKASKNWDAYEPAFLRLMKDRGAEEKLKSIDALGGTLALLCSEPRAEKCHRRLVAEMLAEEWRKAGEAVEVRHLYLEKPGPKPRTKRERRARGIEAADH